MIDINVIKLKNTLLKNTNGEESKGENRNKNINHEESGTKESKERKEGRDITKNDMKETRIVRQ